MKKTALLTCSFFFFLTVISAVPFRDNITASKSQNGPDKRLVQNIDPIAFPKDNFTLETKTIRTSKGEKIVTYRSYLHILYVSNPVDKDYQSLNVSVPVKVDDKAVDASDAPILFVIGVGGYMSVNNMRGGVGGGPGGPGGPGGESKISDKSDLALAGSR